MLRRRGIFLGDLHYPFHQPVVLSIALYLTIKSNPAYVCQVGDLVDQYSSSRFPRSYNVFTPKHEKQWSRYYAELMWKLLREHLPKAELYQIKGNHDVRPERRVIDKAPEFETDLETSMRAHYEFDGVKTIHDAREELYIDDICVVHGYFSGAGDKHAMFNLRNVVCGHTHRGNISFVRNAGHDGGCIWEANAGYLADPYSPGLAYCMQRRATRWTWGILEVDFKGPKFIPLHPSHAVHFEKSALFQKIRGMFAYSRPG